MDHSASAAAWGSYGRTAGAAYLSNATVADTTVSEMVRQSRYAVTLAPSIRGSTTLRKKSSVFCGNTLP